MVQREGDSWEGGSVADLRDLSHRELRGVQPCIRKRALFGEEFGHLCENKGENQRYLMFCKFN